MPPNSANPRVFLSSTTQTLQEFRTKAFDAIQKMNFFCTRMEDFPQSAGTAILDFCHEKIKECDIFIGLLGPLYGSSPAGHSKSYSELEHDIATALGKPCIMFCTLDDMPIKANLREVDAKHRQQLEFRKRVADKDEIQIMVGDASEFARAITVALHNWVIRRWYTVSGLDVRRREEKLEKKHLDRILLDLQQSRPNRTQQIYFDKSIGSRWEAEECIRRLVLRMGFAWVPADYASTGSHGFIRIIRRGSDTGIYVPVQIFTTQSHSITGPTGTKEDQEDFKANRLVILYDIRTNNLYWKGIRGTDLGAKFCDKKVRVVAIVVRGMLRVNFTNLDKFGEHSKGPLIRFAEECFGRYIAIRFMPTWKAQLGYGYRSVRSEAKTFFKAWRKVDCISPVLGPVSVTLRAWRHLTRQRKSEQEIAWKLQLLQVARAIIEKSNWVRVRRTVPALPRAAKRTFYEHVAIVKFGWRGDALVRVITEQIGDGPVRFYSVYEASI